MKDLAFIANSFSRLYQWGKAIKLIEIPQGLDGDVTESLDALITLTSKGYLSDSVWLIAQERLRQLLYEKYDKQLDQDTNNAGELGRAAVSYLHADEDDPKRKEIGDVSSISWAYFPWLYEYWKPKDRISNLVRAGALIAAEIDRLQSLKK